MKFAQRSYDQEIMDDLQINDAGLLQTLSELDFINKWLGGNLPTLNALTSLLKEKSSHEEITIIDMGCGSGEMLRLIDKKFRSKFPHLKLIGIDANPHIIDYAKSQSENYDISFQTKDVFNMGNWEADIIVSTLFLHHFNEEELKQLASEWKEKTKIAVVINDIHRHWIAYYSISILTHLFSNSYMTKYDAKLSVRRAFKKIDLTVFYKNINWRDTKVKWCWAFRWLVILKK